MCHVRKNSKSSLLTESQLKVEQWNSFYRDFLLSSEVPLNPSLQSHLHKHEKGPRTHFSRPRYKWTAVNLRIFTTAPSIDNEGSGGKFLLGSRNYEDLRTRELGWSREERERARSARQRKAIGPARKCWWPRGLWEWDMGEGDSQPALTGPRIYSCCNCRCHVADHDDIISKCFQVLVVTSGMSSGGGGRGGSCQSLLSTSYPFRDGVESRESFCYGLPSGSI